MKSEKDLSRFAEAQAIIKDLQQAIEQKKRVRENLFEINPEWEQLSDEHWEQQEARCWIHGATEVREANELERWVFDVPPISDIAQQDATECVEGWQSFYQEGSEDCRELDETALDQPLEKENLQDYILRVAALREKHGKGNYWEWRTLKSFLAYLRKFPSIQTSFIEQIFPKEGDLLSIGARKRIIRKVDPESYPIPQRVTRDILYRLADMATDRRSNGLLSALESLGLSWLCLIASRLRLPIHLEMIAKTKASAISIDSGCPSILIPTLMGNRKCKISNLVAEFLIALSKIPSKKPRESIFNIYRLNKLPITSIILLQRGSFGII
jgi:hypothetical protein